MTSNTHHGQDGDKALLSLWISKDPSLKPKALQRMALKESTWQYKGSMNVKKDMRQKIHRWLTAWTKRMYVKVLPDDRVSLNKWLEVQTHTNSSNHIIHHFHVIDFTQNHQPLDPTSDEDAHRPITMTLPGEGIGSTEQVPTKSPVFDFDFCYHHHHHHDLEVPNPIFCPTQVGLKVTITTKHLASRLKPGHLKYLLSDTTYKVSANGITLLVTGVVDEHGTFHMTTATFTSRETKEAIGAVWTEIDAALQRWWGVRLTPGGVVTDNDDAAFAASKDFGPCHWPDLVTRGQIIRVNCAVHMDLGLSGPKGKVKFSSSSDSPLKTKKTQLNRKKMPALRDEAKNHGLDTTGLRKDLLARLLDYWKEEYRKMESQEFKQPDVVVDDVEDEDSPKEDDDRDDNDLDSGMPQCHNSGPQDMSLMLVDIQSAAAAAASAAALAAAEPEDQEIQADAEADSNYDKYHRKFMIDLHVITNMLATKDFITSAFLLLCQKWQLVIPKVIANLRAEYWGNPKGNWQRAICWQNNNNPLERFNRTMKDEWTFHKKMKWTVLFESFLSYLEGVSLTDAEIPDPARPYFMAPPDREWPRDRLITLWKKVSWEGPAIVARARKPYLDLWPEGTLLILNATYEPLNLTKSQLEALEALYCTSTPNQGVGFDVYVARRTCFYVLTPNMASPLDSTCTCPVHLQRRTCKHSLAWGISQGGEFPDGCDYRRVTPYARKPGRPSEKQNCLKRDTGLRPPQFTCPVDPDYDEVRLGPAEDVVTLFDIQLAPVVPEAITPPPNLGLRV